MRQQIQNALGTTHPWASALQWFDVIDSTNTRAKLLADAGAPHGTVLIADRQTGGRGRMGRSFHSPGGMGIYMSVILRPECAPDKLMHLTCSAAVAVCNAIEQTVGVRPGIKWINDLVLCERKLGGILTELSLLPTGNVRYAVIGIGINCAQRSEDFAPELQSIATSLEIATGKTVSRCALAAAMIQALEQMSRGLLTEKASTLDLYRRDCITLGKDVYILRGDERTPAKAIDINDDGSLLVQLSDGTTTPVQSGEVSVRGLYGYC